MLKNSKSQHFRSNGKLMLTGEYLVLQGALSLALPTRLGQDMSIVETDEPILFWNATVKGKTWFSAQFSLADLAILSSNCAEVAQTLQLVLRTTKQLNNNFLNNNLGNIVNTNLEFNLDWGLGSSSSLISNVAYWANCDPYVLNQKIFKGSGYDIACARSNKPVLYHLNNKSNPEVELVDFYPDYADHLYFIWLNQKQDTREAIGKFDESENYDQIITSTNAIARKMLSCNKLFEFQKLIEEHENILSEVLKTAKVKERLFPDFEGAIKSLGAWGGDFLLAASNKSFNEVTNYFKQKGFNTVSQYGQIIR